MLSTGVLLGYGDCYPTYFGAPYVLYPLQIPYLLPTPPGPVLELRSQSSDHESEAQQREGICRRHTRKTWTKQEDAKILKVIREMKLSSEERIPYRVIAKHFPDRTSKQIRERYLNKLDSQILKPEFTDLEDRAIIEYYLQNGPKWKHLSGVLKGRTPTSLKNRFNTKLKQRLVAS